MKFMDLELEDPITRLLYQVQVKSSATLADFRSYSEKFDRQRHSKFYFVVHTPDQGLAAVQEGSEDVELILPDRLSEMAVRLGLVEWLMSHIK